MIAEALEMLERYRRELGKYAEKPDSGIAMTCPLRIVQANATAAGEQPRAGEVFQSCMQWIYVYPREQSADSAATAGGTWRLPSFG
jgi:hypothetical protein